VLDAQPWLGQPHVTALSISRLTQRDVEGMINGLVGNKLLPASIRQDIIERTDGIPLFVEEMTKAVLEPVNASAFARSSPGHILQRPTEKLSASSKLHFAKGLRPCLSELGPTDRRIVRLAASLQLASATW
jgi:predicted ATPase